MVGWVAGKSNFNENPVVSLDLDLDFGLRIRVCQYLVYLSCRVTPDGGEQGEHISMYFSSIGSSPDNNVLLVLEQFDLTVETLSMFLCGRWQVEP